MKSLYLLRHAKSSWDEAGLADFDRPLNGRGREAARFLAAYFHAHGIKPALVLCSSARRTRETWEAVGRGLTTELAEEKELYLAGADELMDRLRRIPSGVPSVLLIGHNPGLGDLAMRLAGPGSKLRDLAVMAEKYPTGGLAIFSFAGRDWNAMDRDSCCLLSFLRPRDIEAG